MYDTVDEAKMRLGNTCVYYQGKPVYVETCFEGGAMDPPQRIKYKVDADGQRIFDINGNWIVEKPKKVPAKGGIHARVYPLPFKPGGRFEDVSLEANVDDWNVRDFPLGYCNTDYGAYYVQRMPCRKYKQGVCADNIFVKHARGQDPIGFNALMRTEGLAEMFNRKYPSYDKAREMLEKDAGLFSVAFSRRLALSRDRDLGFFVLLHRGERVAFGDPMAFTLPAEHERLKELLQLHGVTSR